MKKIQHFLLYLILSLAVFTKTYDEAKYRSDLLATANSWIGTPYKYGGSSRNGIDCSHFTYVINQSAGMKGITGRGYAATASLRSSGLAKNISYNDLKPGDAILMGPNSKGVGHVMIVNRILGNGKIEIIDAAGGSIGKVSVRTINFPPSRYAGVITATDTLIANGYTPVNSDGTVIVPPPGSYINGSDEAGKTITGASTKSSLLVDWDKIQGEIMEMSDEGIEKMLSGLLVLLVVLTSLEIMWVLYGYIAKNSIESIWISLIRILIKFSILAYIIPNALTLIDMGYDLFSGIGSYFVPSGELTLNGIWSLAGREAAKIFKIINESNFNMWNLVFDIQQFYEEIGKMLLLFIILVLIYYFVVRILVEMLMATIQYRLGLGLAWLFLPFEVNSVARRDLGNKALTVFFLTGTKIVVISVLGRIAFKNLEAASFGEVTFKELEYQTIFIYITVGMVMARMMNRVNDITKILARGS